MIRTYLVTGASRGIGRAIAEALAESGVRLILHNRQASDEARSICERCSERGSDVVRTEADLSTQTGVESLLAQVRKVGPLHGLVNNAGVYEEADLFGTDVGEWERVMGINLRAPFFLIRGLAPNLQEAGGAVVNLSSIMGHRPSPGAYPYQASKAALRHLTKALALELAPHVRVNTVSPGFIMTDINSGAWQNPAFRRQVEGETPLARWGQPDDIAGVVRFLLSDEARFITGQTLLVDGGKGL